MDKDLDLSAIGVPTGKTPPPLFEPLPAVPRALCGLCGKPTLWSRPVERGEVAMADDLEMQRTRGVTVQCQDDRAYHVKNEPSAWVEGMLRTVTLDICPDCFEGKLAPWFISQGGAVRVTDEAWGDDAGYAKPDLNATFEEPLTEAERAILG